MQYNVYTICSVNDTQIYKGSPYIILNFEQLYTIFLCS